MANKSLALRPNEIEFDKITFSDPRAMSSGGKMIYVNHHGNSLYMQTPELESPFDNQFYPDGSDEKGKITINVSLKGHEEEKKVKEFFDVLVNFDEKVKGACIENSVSWHKKQKMSMETVENLYVDMARLHTDDDGVPDGKYPPQFRYKVSKKDGKWECRFYDQDRNLIEEPNVESLLRKGCKIKALLRCTGVWIAAGKFGCSWKAEQLIVRKPETLDDFAFRSDDEDDEDDGETSNGVTFAESDSDEKESEESEEEEVVVKKTPKGKGKK